MELCFVLWTRGTEYQFTNQWNFICKITEMLLDVAVAHTPEQKAVTMF